MYMYTEHTQNCTQKAYNTQLVHVYTYTCMFAIWLSNTTLNMYKYMYMYMCVYTCTHLQKCSQYMYMYFSNLNRQFCNQRVSVVNLKSVTGHRSHLLLSMASLSSLFFLTLAPCLKMPRVLGPSTHSLTKISYEKGNKKWSKYSI